MDRLEEKLTKRTAKIGIIGLGYVGLPLAVEFASKGFQVTGFDIDRSKVGQIKEGVSYIPDVPTEQLSKLAKSGHLGATTDFEKLGLTDAVIICVPTPLGKSRDPDLSFILTSVQQVKKTLHKDQLVVLESTTFPGTTKDVVLPILAETGLKVGKDFYLAFSPERVDPANKTFGIHNTPKVVGGTTPQCQSLATLLYQQVTEQVVPVSSTQVAELVKLLENTFRAVNIGLINEVAMICNKLGVETGEVVAAAATKPFGFMPFYPGPGLGGHCIPVDPQYLSWKMRTLNYHPRFIQLADEINMGMPGYIVSRMGEALNEEKKAIRGSKILVLGLTYKRDVGDLRESPAIEVVLELLKLGAKVSFHDPFVPSYDFGGTKLASTPLTATELANSDCTAILTDHSSFNYETIVKESKLLFDTRNATRGKPTPNGTKIIRL